MKSEHVDGRFATADVTDEADFVIVGTGAAGATAARTLTGAGYEVVLIEEGQWFTKEDFEKPLGHTMNSMFRDAGGQVAAGRAFIPIIQGRVVGGSTVINSAIVWRLPDDVHAEWVDYGIGDAIPFDELNDCFDAIESEITVTLTEESAQGYSNLLMGEAARRLGLKAAPTTRYTKDCKGAGLCLQGCPHGAKQSMAVSYVPQAIRQGARLYASCRVERLLRINGRVGGVRALFAHPESGRGKYHLTVTARKGVLLAASAIQTPALMRRSGLKRGGVGDHFQAHPGIPLFGLFDVPERAWLGATPGFVFDHYRKTQRFKVEVLNLPPEMILTRLPGIGSSLREYIADFDKFGLWVTQNRLKAHGKVRPFGRDVRVSYTPTAGDMQRVRFGLKVMMEMMFSVGARAVFPGVYGLPMRMGPDDLKLVDDAPLDPRPYMWLATHLFGTARMGKDPRTSVVGENFESHEAKGLYVIDSSVFPTNLGVNPQHTIMAVAMLAARRLAA